MKSLSENISENISLAIIIPVLDDWKSLVNLISKLDCALPRKNLRVEIIIVDDGSSLTFDESDFDVPKPENIAKICVLELKRNVGHQRAIALGLAFVAAERADYQAALVMDGDGEDKPEDAVKLIEKCRRENFSKLIFAKRSKRSEGAIFTFFYRLYVNFFKVFTGQNISVGNFSIIPRKIFTPSGRRFRYLESLRGRRSEGARSLHGNRNRTRQSAARLFKNEFRFAGDARFKRDFGLRRYGRRALAAGNLHFDFFVAGRSFDRRRRENFYRFGDSRLGDLRYRAAFWYF